MTQEQAKYHLETLPMRQKMIRAMANEPWQSVDSIRILRKEFEQNKQTLKQAREVLGQ